MTTAGLVIPGAQPTHRTATVLGPNGDVISKMTRLAARNVRLTRIEAGETFEVDEADITIWEVPC